MYHACPPQTPAHTDALRNHHRPSFAIILETLVRLRQQLGGRTARLRPYKPVSSGGLLISAGQAMLQHNEARHKAREDEFIIDLIRVRLGVCAMGGVLKQGEGRIAGEAREVSQAPSILSKPSP